jgi:butyrate kinase
MNRLSPVFQHFHDSVTAERNIIMSYKILVINPGSTSTKIGVYEDETQLFEKTLRHPTEEIAKYATIVDQKDFRMNMILDMLKENDFDVKTLDVVVGRGGLLKPIPGGTYAVSDDLLKDLIAGVQGQHASNLGGILAREIGDSIGVPSYIVDPVVVDELGDVARISGVPELPRISIFHALNQKAVAKRYAKEQGVPYESLNLIVAHMGGGCSVGAHQGGKVIDVNNTLDGDGPFSPERSGGVPAGALIKLCFSGKYSEQEVYKKINGKGGTNAYLGTNDMREVLKRAQDGDAQAQLVFDAFTYQVAKDIGAMATVLKGKVDQIILTGGIAYGSAVVDAIKERVSFISGVTVYAGEDELLALTQGALRVLNGEEEAKVY